MLLRQKVPLISLPLISSSLGVASPLQWTPLFGTAFVVGLMGYTSYFAFWKADERERQHRRELQRQRAAAAAGTKLSAAEAAAANKVLSAARKLAKK